MDGRAQRRSQAEWLKFDQMVLTLAAFGALGLTLLSHWGYGPTTFRACLERWATVQSSSVSSGAEQDQNSNAKNVSRSPPAREIPIVPVTFAPAIGAFKSGRDVVVTGLLPSSQIKAEFLADAQRASGDGVIVDQIVVDPEIKPSHWTGYGDDIIYLLKSLRGKAEIQASGDAVRLTGIATDTTDREVAGLRAVEIFGPAFKLYNLIQVRAPKEALVEIETRGRRAVVTGYVRSDEDYVAIMQSLKTVFGGGDITDRLAVDDNLKPLIWRLSAAPIAAALSAQAKPSAIRIRGSVAELTGSAWSWMDKVARGDAMQKLLGSSMTLDNQITIRSLVPPLVDFQNDNGTISIAGRVGDETARAAVLDAAAAAFGQTKILDHLSIDDATAPVTWLGQSGRILNSLFKLDTAGGLRVEGRRITLTGIAASDGERQARDLEARAIFGPIAEIDNQIRVEAPVPALFESPEPSALGEPDIDPAKLPPPEPEPQVANIPPPVPVVDCKMLEAGYSVEFETNKAELTDTGRKSLDDAAVCLKTGRYEVGGHSDSSGNQGWNRDLSLLRAKAAVTYLKSKGVAQDQLVVKGYGSSLPIASNRAPEGRAKNRRITFVPIP